MFYTLLAGLVIAIGALEAYLGYTLPADRNSSNENKSNEDIPNMQSKFLIFQRIYFILMGIYTIILGAFALFKKNAIPTYLLIILVILPIFADKLIGTAIQNKQNS